VKARKIATAPARGLKSLGRMVFPRYGGFMRWFLPRSRFNYAREVGDGLSSSVVCAPILWMARTFPEAPLQVVDADEAPVEGHTLIAKIRRPNPYYSGIVLWMATLLSWVVSGDAYWLKVRDGNGGIAELWYVPHWMIHPVGDDKDLVTHYEYRPDGQEIRLENDDVVHFRYGLDPQDPKRGLSPLGSVLREVFTDDEAANFTAALLHNMGIPGVIVSPDSDESPGPDDVKAVKDQFDSDFSGDRRGKPMVMSGKTKVQQFGFSPEQLTLTGLRRIPEERVTAVLGLPAIVAGFGAGLERSTFANFEEAREAAYESCQVPNWRLFGEEITFQLLPDFDDDRSHEAVFDVKKVRALQDDRNKEADRLATLVRAGIYTRAKALKALGEEADAGDEVYLIPISTIVTPAGELPEPALDPADPTAPPKRRTKGAAAQNRLIEALDRSAAKLQAVLAQQVELDLSELGRRAAEVYDRLAPGLASHTNGHRKAADESAADRIATALSLSDWVDGTLKTRLETHYQRTAAQTVDTINQVLELGVSLPDPVERAIIDAGGTRRGLFDIEQGTKDAIYKALADAREQGLGPADAARLIRSYVPAGRFADGAGVQYRSQLIARTETKVAQNLSSVAAYKESGTVASVTIYDGRLENSDAECAARDGEVVSFDEAEAMSLEEHPNGSLSFAPNVGDPAAV
jgi:HK97 family phage portal protein